MRSWRSLPLWGTVALLCVSVLLGGSRCAGEEQGHGSQSNWSWHTPSDSDFAIVFVHGVLSDNTKCWKYTPKEGRAANWPDLIAKDIRFGNVGIFLAGYPAKAFDGKSGYAIPEAAETIWEALRGRDAKNHAPVMSKKNILFITHSTGGLLVKRLLEKHWPDFTQKNVAVALIACPSLGSKLGSSFEWISRSSNTTLEQV